MFVFKKYFNICTLYILLWVLYSLQGSLYERGSIVSRILLVVVLLISIYYCVSVNVKSKSHPFIKALNVLLLMFTIYGLIYFFSPVTYHLGGYLDDGVSKMDFLKSIYISLLPIYAFYNFTSRNLLNEQSIKWILILLVLATTLSYTTIQEEMVEEALTMGSVRDEFTNNEAYKFVALLPLLFFWNKKPIVQYALMFYIVAFVFMGMKRGAMLIAILGVLWFVFRMYKNNSGVRRLFLVALSVVTIIVGLFYFGQLYSTSEYFQRRIEASLSGDSSGRDVIYSTLWQHFVNENSVVKLLFGNGPDFTLSIVGNYAHNDWLELLICHGVCGCIIYLFYFVTLVKTLFKARNNQIVTNVLGMVICIVFISSLFSMSYNSLSLALSISIGWSVAKSFKDHEEIRIFGIRGCER